MEESDRKVRGLWDTRVTAPADRAAMPPLVPWSLIMALKMKALLEALAPGRKILRWREPSTPGGSPRTSPSSWTATAAGPAAQPASRGRSQGRRSRGSNHRRNLRPAGRRRADAVRVLGGELETAAHGSRNAVAAAAHLPAPELALMMRHDIRFTAIGRLEALPAPVGRSWRT